VFIVPPRPDAAFLEGGFILAKVIFPFRVMINPARAAVGP
jgi:hypothetical protein